MALTIDEQIVEADSDDSDDKLMMTEYDEDNVIVIDLSEERNGSTKNLELTGQDVPDHLRAQRPRKTMFGSSDEAEPEPQSGVFIDNAIESEHNGSAKNLELTEQDVPDHLRAQRPRKTMFGYSDEAEHEEPPQPTVVIANTTEAETETEASLNGTPSLQPDVNNGASGMLEYLQFFCVYTGVNIFPKIAIYSPRFENPSLEYQTPSPDKARKF